MSRIGIVTHGADVRAQTEATNLTSELTAAGHTVVVIDGDPVDEPSADAPTAVSAESFAEGLHLAISLGGDGTMLRTVALLGDSEVKILGVNFGDLGYLTVTEPEQLSSSVARSLAGDHEIEERMLVAGAVRGETVHALNDIVVERAPGDTSVRIGVMIDGQRFTSYPADGLILATATGSTAYALSARGPIVAPNHACMQLTPVSPHMLFDRTLVLGPESLIELTVEGHRKAAVSVDGRTVFEMEPGETLRCRRSERIARLITFGDRDHLSVLKSKLGLTDR